MLSDYNLNKYLHWILSINKSETNLKLKNTFTQQEDQLPSLCSRGI